MKLCENCNDKIINHYGSGRFCCNKCARSYSTKLSRKEINKKVSKTLKGFNHTEETKNKLRGKNNGSYKRALAIKKQISELSILSGLNLYFYFYTLLLVIFHKELLIIQNILTITEKKHRLAKHTDSYNEEIEIDENFDPEKEFVKYLNNLKIKRNKNLQEDKPKRKIKSNGWLGKKHTEETKRKLSESMKKAHREERAFNIGQKRWNNEPTYPEKFFMKFFKKIGLELGKDYNREVVFGRYRADFYFPEIKLIIEIDGGQHEIKQHKLRDIRKDAFIYSNYEDVKIVRIKWNDLFHNTKAYLKKVEKFIKLKYRNIEIFKTQNV